VEQKLMKQWFFKITEYADVRVHRAAFVCRCRVRRLAMCG
jgi:leucyl-tRNA synthetase